MLLKYRAADVIERRGDSVCIYLSLFQKIVGALKRAMANRTTIIIAHRLATVVDADEILVLRRGSIAERGTHQQLLAQTESLYARLWRRQHRAALEHQAATLNNNNNNNNTEHESGPS